MLLKKPGQFAVGSATQSGAGLLDLNFLNSDATLSNTITHSRAGNATMVASDGLIKWAPHNLLTYSEDFSQWNKNSATVTANDTTAPDGTTTADKLVCSVDNAGIVFEDIAPASGVAHTFSVYLKAGTHQYAFLSLTRSNIEWYAAVFDLSAGTV